MNGIGRGLRTLTLDVALRAREELLLPGWTGSTLHGALGTTLAAVSCSPACLRSHALGARPCAYSRLFEEPVPRGDEKGVIAGMRPHPLVLRPPAPGEPRALGAGDRFGFGVTLVGPAIGDLRPLLAALEEMASRGLGKGRGSARLESVSSAGKVVFRPPRTLRAPAPDGGRELAGGRAVRIRATTPLRLYRAGELIDEPTFGDLVDAALRRYEALVTYHGEPEAPPLGEACRAVEPAREVVARELEWRRFRAIRYSSRQDQKHPMAGVMGRATYEGAIARYGELLEVATRIGIGKATSFGFGLIELEPV